MAFGKNSPGARQTSKTTPMSEDGPQSEYTGIAAAFAKAKAEQEAKGLRPRNEDSKAYNKQQERQFKRSLVRLIGFLSLILYELTSICATFDRPMLIRTTAYYTSLESICSQAASYSHDWSSTISRTALYFQQM